MSPRFVRREIAPTASFVCKVVIAIGNRLEYALLQIFPSSTRSVRFSPHSAFHRWNRTNCLRTGRNNGSYLGEGVCVRLTLVTNDLRPSLCSPLRERQQCDLCFSAPVQQLIVLRLLAIARQRRPDTFPCSNDSICPYMLLGSDFEPAGWDCPATHCWASTAMAFHRYPFYFATPTAACTASLISKASRIDPFVCQFVSSARSILTMSIL